MCAPARSTSRSPRRCSCTWRSTKQVALGRCRRSPRDRIAPRLSEDEQLILATGARHSYFGKEEFERFAPGLKTLAVAWLAWVAVHLEFLGQSSLRISVFVQWAWTYLTGQRGSRLIVNHRASEPPPAAADAPQRSVASNV